MVNSESIDSRVIPESKKPGTRAKTKHKKVYRRLSSQRRRR